MKQYEHQDETSRTARHLLLSL